MALLQDGRRIKTDSVSALTVEDLRHLVKWCDNQTESWWVPAQLPALSVAQILACYHAANDAGFAGMDEWRSDGVEACNACIEAWTAVVEGVR
jgi:hypothetical protein